LEVVRNVWDAWLGGDMARLLTYYDPAVVWDLTHFREWPDNTYHGHDGLLRFLDEWLEVWDNFETDVEEIVAAPDGRVLSLAWQRGTGRESGLPMEMEWALIGTVRDGRVVRVEHYDDRLEAFAAVGLSE
jgi:ketosteroid isomerase-like protein